MFITPLENKLLSAPIRSGFLTFPRLRPDPRRGRKRGTHPILTSGIPSRPWREQKLNHAKSAKYATKL